MTILRAILVCVLTIAPVASFGEIHKVAVTGQNGVAFKWWPKVSAPPGWRNDERSSLRYGINAFSPMGATFNSAETVLYARAIYKPRRPELASLRDLIDQDKSTFRARDPKIKIKSQSVIQTLDGQRMKTLTFIPSKTGNHERVAYGEEGEFFLVFVVSSKSSTGLNATMAAFETFVQNYRR